ncbi:MAG: substrate-binding domain-containing protein [Planctomycetota bacterium]
MGDIDAGEASMRRIAVLTPGPRTHVGNTSARFLRGVYDFFRPSLPWSIRTGPDALEPAMILRWQPDGVIVWSEVPALVDALAVAGIPMVTALSEDPVAPPAVAIDEEAIGAAAAHHLLDQGWERFGCTGNAPYVRSQRRKRGFVDTLTTAGFACDIYQRERFGYTPRTAGDWAEASRRSQAWIMELDRPAAVFATDDYTGYLFLDAIIRTGLHVPGDIALIAAHNDISLCEMSHPALSSVDVPYRRAGWEAARRLHDLIRDGVCDEDCVLAPLDIVERESTDRVPRTDELARAALAFIREHLAEPINVETLLIELGVSRRTLETRFRNVLGHSPLREIHRQRVRLGRRYLQQGNRSIEVIARLTGFASAERFREAFRRETGVNPSDYSDSHTWSA